MARKGGAPENLKPAKTADEAKQRGKNGGIKSGEARRKKRDAKQAAKLILELPCDESFAKNLKKMNIDKEDFTNVVAMYARAFTLGMQGNIAAFKFIVESAGQDQKYLLDERRFENELGRQEGSNNAVDDWVNSIPDVVDSEVVENGDTGTD